MQVKAVVTGTEAAFKELAASKRILEIQQKENYKQQEYLSMVEGELDRTKKLVEIVPCYRIILNGLILIF